MAEKRESLRISRYSELGRSGNFIRLDHFKLDYRFVGASGEPVEQTLERVNVYRGDAVAGLLHFASANELHLVDQFRFSTMLSPEDGLPDLARFRQGRTYDGDGRFIELMAGNVSRSEPPLEAFRREAFEETGFELDEVEFICTFYPSPGACSERIHLYYGRIDEARGRTESAHHGVDDEYIREIRVSPSQFLQAIADNRIMDAKAFAAAEWMRRPENRSRFGLG